MGQGGNDSSLDTSQIMMRINMLNVEVNKKIDITVIMDKIESTKGELTQVMT